MYIERENMNVCVTPGRIPGASRRIPENPGESRRILGESWENPGRIPETPGRIPGESRRLLGESRENPGDSRRIPGESRRLPAIPGESRRLSDPGFPWPDSPCSAPRPMCSLKRGVKRTATYILAMFYPPLKCIRGCV